MANIVQDTGILTPISSAIRGGFLPEPAATDLLTARADARDMTTANWILGATCTRARTATGADGVANKATTLTFGAVAATNTILTTITAAASSRTYSAAVKRRTGTGPIRMTQDGFATNTDITALINSSTYTIVGIVQSQLNAQLGFKGDTNGDQIDVDWNQFSAGDLTGAGIINSRIPDTITTRNADVDSYATTGWYNSTVGTLFAQFIQPPNDGLTHVVAELNDGTVNNRITISTSGGTNTTLIVVGGVNKYSATLAAPSAGTVCKIAMAWAVNDGVSYQNNAAMTIGTAGTTLPAGITTLNIGHEVSSSQQATYNQKDAYYPTRLPNSVAQALTA